jgi:hypothetical protein
MSSFCIAGATLPGYYLVITWLLLGRKRIGGRQEVQPFLVDAGNFIRQQAYHFNLSAALTG